MNTANDNGLSDIYDILYQFGITATNCGFFQMSYAIHLAMGDPELMTMITKLLYPRVAHQYKTNWRNVEHNLRRVARHAWKNNPDLLRKMAHYHIFSAPSASRFIAIVAAHLKSRDQIASGVI